MFDHRIKTNLPKIQLINMPKCARYLVHDEEYTLWSNPFFVQPLIYRCWLFWHTQPDKIIPNKHTLDHIRSKLSHSNEWLLLTLSANSFSVWKISYFCVTFEGVYLPISKIILKKMWRNTIDKNESLWHFHCH